MSAPHERERAHFAGAHTHDRLDEFRLAVALDARDAEHLALVDVEAHVVDHRPPVAGAHGQVAYGQGDDVGDGRLAGLGAGQLAADHELGELAGGHVLGVHGRHGGAAPDDGDLVGHPEDLVQLVGDEQDRQPLADQAAQVVEQLVHLVGHEHGGRLVQDQDAGAPIEHLEDLHPLAVADTQVLDRHVRLHAQAVRVGDLLDLLACGGEVQGEAAAARLAAQDHVLQDGQVVGQHEVLVDHADAHGDGVGGGVEAHGRPVDADLALVWALHPVQDLHQRGLPRAVLAYEGVDVPLGDAEVDVAVGDDSREPLGDPGEFYCGFRGGRGGNVGLLFAECPVRSSDSESRAKGPGRVPPGPSNAQVRTSGP